MEPIKYPKGIDKLIDALNNLDEWASMSNRDNDNGEVQKQMREYNKLFDFITKKQAITIPFSESDIQELGSGEEFHWTFPTKAGQDIDVHIINEETMSEEELEEDMHITKD